MADAITMAQTGVDPRTGSYLSAEARKALFRRATVSSSVFRGNRGGALVRQDRNELATSQGLAIVRANQSTLGTVSKQIEYVRVEVLNLTNGVRNIANLLRGESIVEQRRIQQEQDTEQRLADREIKRGRENELEKKIQNALASPVQRVISKTEGIFDRIKGALYTLLGGWFTLQGLQLLQAFRDKNFKVFDEIRNSLLKNLLYAGAGLLAINVGFSVFLRLLNTVVFKVAGLIAKIITLPFRGLGALGRGVAGLFGRGAQTALRGAGALRGGRVPVTGSTNLMTKFFNFMRGAGRVEAGAAAKTGSRFVPGLSTVVSGGLAAYDFSQGDILGGSLNAIGMVPGPIGWLGTLGRIGLEGTRMMGGDKPQSQPQPKPKQKPQSTPQSSLTPPPPSSQAPQQSAMSDFMTGFSNDVNLNVTPPGQQSQPSAQIQTPSTPSPALVAPMSEASQSDKQISDFVESTFAEVSKMQSVNSQASTLGPVTMPAPQVVLSSPESKSQPPKPTMSKRMSNDIPQIPSSNPNNFYTMYSQLNYNVVV